MISESLTALLSGVKFWKDRKKDEAQERRLREQAIGVVLDAAMATKAYLYDIEKGLPANRDREHELSRLWQGAGSAISQYDRQLFDSGRLKALGWADPREWSRAEGREWTISLDNIIQQCDWLRCNG